MCRWNEGPSDPSSCPSAGPKSVTLHLAAESFLRSVMRLRRVAVIYSHSRHFSVLFASGCNSEAGRETQLNKRSLSPSCGWKLNGRAPLSNVIVAALGDRESPQSTGSFIYWATSYVHCTLKLTKKNLRMHSFIWF